MAIHLITGHAGENHVTSGDAGRLIAGIVGRGKYVLRTGTQLAATIINSNTLRIGSGDIVDQGRQVNIPAGSYEEVNIANGAQGKRRIDTIAMRYTMTAGIESASLVVISGTEVSTASTPEPPTLTTGDIFSGAALDEMALYHVAINELQIESVTAAYALAPCLTSIVDMIYPVGSIYMTTGSENPANLWPGTKWYTISGRFLLGSSTSYAAGTRGGAASHTISAAELPAHTHDIPAHSHSIPEHTHRAVAETAGAHTHSINVLKTAGSGSARLVVTNDDGIGTKQTSQAGAHTHDINVYASDADRTGATEGTTYSTGGGDAMSIMPPYMVCNMWRRYE